MRLKRGKTGAQPLIRATALQCTPLSTALSSLRLEQPYPLSSHTDLYHVTFSSSLLVFLKKPVGPHLFQVFSSQLHPVSLLPGSCRWVWGLWDPGRQDWAKENLLHCDDSDYLCSAWLLYCTKLPFFCNMQVWCLYIECFSSVILILCNPVYRFLVGMFTQGQVLSAYVLTLELLGPSKRTVVGLTLMGVFAFSFPILAVLAYYITEWRTLYLACTLIVLPFCFLWW